MNNKLVFKKSFINFGVKIITQLLNLALLPIYILYLKTHEYGILNLGSVFLNFFVILTSCGLGESLLRFQNKAKTARLKKIILSNILIFISAATLLMFIVILPFQENISLLFFNDPALSSFLVLIIFLGIFESWNSVLLMLLQVEGKNVLYGKLLIIKNAVKVVLTFILLKYFDLNIYGAVAAMAFSAIIFIISSYSILKERFTLKFSKKVFKILIHYGWPFVITSISLSALFQIDQYILKFLIGLEAVAVYGLAYKIGSSIQYVNSSFSLAWFPQLFALNDANARKNINEMLGYYLAVLMLIGILFNIFNNFIFPNVFPQEYLMAVEIIPWVIWAYVVFGLSDFMSAGLLIKFKSSSYSVISILSALINIVLNIIFIPLYGIKAAAIVTFISMSFFTMFSYMVTMRIYKLKLPYLKYLRIILPNCIVLFLIYNVLATDFHQGIIYVIIFSALTLVIPVLSGVLKWQHFRQLAALIKNR